MIFTCDKKKAAVRKYVPFPLGNGDLSFQVDYLGGMKQRRWPGGMIPGIYRAGYRYNNVDGHSLVPFGYFDWENQDEPLDWTQAFDSDSALCTCVCEYDGGLSVRTELFCMLNRNIIGIRRRVSGKQRPALHYFLDAPRMKLRAGSNGRIDYSIDTVNSPSGTIWLVSSAQKSFLNGNGFELAADDYELTAFIAFGNAEAAYAASQGFDKLLEENRTEWGTFWAESRISDIEESLLRVCRTAEYHLRISSTRWSIPVGLFPTHWQGRYFGFDEFFSCCGLAATGHLKDAIKVPLFRHEILPSAKQRAYSYFGRECEFAKYPWETIEMPGVEGAPPGFWLEHIFHMAHIALEAKFCFEQNRDLEFLKNSAYPVIRACAEFFRIQASSERPDGTVIISKCTDLERLGAARENPFMTTCSAIATLCAAADSAELLNCDDDLILRWRDMAKRLTESLPVENGRYVPYPGCKDSSVALLSGLYPYNVLPPDNPEQLAALDDFLQREAEFGNMYPVGHSVCIWYACWKALALLRMGRCDECLSILRECAADTGCFNEIFEIYETEAHPWFTTAEGIYLQALAEYLKVDVPGK